jgi:polysaccharide export outer membrane protein
MISVMKNRKSRTPRLKRVRCWSVVLLLAALTGSSSTLQAQSELRFVDSGSISTSDSTPLPTPTFTTTAAPQPSSTEFRFLEVTESKTAPLPQFTITAPREPLRVAMKPSTAVSRSDASFKTEAKPATSELRFVVTPLGPNADGASAYGAAEITPLPETTTGPAAEESQRVAAATELFATPLSSQPQPQPQPQRTTFKPRIATAVEHVPATVPQYVAAEPVRATRETVPAYTPSGSELFTSAAPSQPTSKPNWDVPALDYGSALRQTPPPQTLAAAPKQIEPLRIVARELPTSATEMFGLGAPEKLVTPQPMATAKTAIQPPAPQAVIAQAPITPVAPVDPIQKPAAMRFTEMPIAAVPRPVAAVATPKPVPAQAAPAAVAVTPAPVAVKPPVVVAARPQVAAAAELDFSRVAKRVEPVAPQVVAAAPVQRSIVAPTAPKAPIASAPTAPTASAPAQVVVAPAKAVEPIAPAVSQPAQAPARTQVVAQPRPQLPAASELDFASLPVTPEPARVIPATVEPPKPQVVHTKPQFMSAAPTYVASATPIAPPAPPAHLVPAAVAPSTMAVSQAPTPFEQELGKLANANAAPDRSQVVVTQESDDPNTYSFRFAGTVGSTPAAYAHNLQPSANGVLPLAVEPGPEAVGPGPETLAMPQGCNCGANGQYGCPYLPGQSGTRALCGVDCGRYGSSCNATWDDAHCIPWALFGPGEYVGPARPAHVETFYLRVNDFLTLTFIASRKKSAEHYRIGVGDELQIEWLQGAGNTETPLDRKLLVQPDGTVTLPMIGEVMAAGKTVNDFRDEAVKLYSKFQRDPQITVTPLTVNVAVQDVLRAVTSKNASSGQTQDLKVTPEGTIQAAGIGSVYVQGLTLDELKSELEARYAEAYGPGLEVSPQLTERATSYVFIGGEVRAPGRYTLEGPTTVTQAIAMAGSWNNGGNLRQVVIFRRDENWCLKATKIDLRAPLYGKDPCPTNDVWLRENDLVLVPKSCILCATDLIELYFTRGVYAVFPINYVYDFSSNSAIVPVP